MRKGGISYREYTKYLVAPFLYRRRLLLNTDDDLSHVDILVTDMEFAHVDFQVRGELLLNSFIVRKLHFNKNFRTARGNAD